ncbi:Uncharacterised protein [Starkeya nomas]|uniref:Uncharacterized protein n=1 Tax=Starkeya nomas TaxID=2666134 RepID=A0A5S9R5S6_9HYPH|nr:hypothetical protein [Starkeya nomas]CAA0129345.1 Uncharacterised protein [Starkeya nomas]
MSEDEIPVEPPVYEETPPAAAPSPYEIKPGSAVFNAAGGIDCEIRPPHLDLPEGDWLPFSATESDANAASADVYTRLLDGEAGPIAPYAAPPPTVPASVTRAQARVALFEAGLLAQVDAAVAAHPYELVRIWWADALNIERNHPYLVAMAVELELTEQQVDQLFITAATRV